ncbi:MAG: EAL domain-containing protein [Ilumatobacteraceae bacterium]
MPTRHRPALRRTPSLLTRFAIVSLAMLVAIGAVVGVRLASIQRERTLDDATRAAEVVAQVGIQPLLRADDLRRNFVPLDEARRAQLDESLLRTVNGDSVVRLKIWNADRWIVYSDNPRLLGRWFPGDADLDRSLAGETVSTITDLSAAEEMEERDFGRLLAVYVPLRVDDAGELTTDEAGEVVGAFEIYLPYAPLATAITADTRQLAIALGVGFVVLYLGLFRLVARASRRLRRQARENEHQATHDTLTDLPNRRLLDRGIAAALDGRRADERVVPVVLDLDRFKEINDTLGHHSGDQVLVTVADRLTAAATAHDRSDANAVGHVDRGDTTLVARLGGDEYAIVLRAPDAAAGIERVESLLRAIETPIDVGGLSVTVRASAGAVVAPDDGHDPESLVRRADIAMYVAKSIPGHLHRFQPDDDEDGADRLELAADLRRALATDELFLVYQPKVHLETGEVVGVEALVRWEHPTRGLVPPDRFVPIVESSDLIGPFTRHVLDMALAQRRRWADDGLELVVAVNVSARDVLDDELRLDLVTRLEHHGVPAAAVELELTESAIVDDTRSTRTELAALRAMGIRIALDDFGTGYASIGNLTGLPIDIVKVDKSFVQHLVDDPASQAVVGFSVDLATHLGLEVVAEGVEDASTMERLRVMGCNVAQGYHLSRPMPADEMVRWVAGWVADRAAGTRTDRPSLVGSES